MSKALTGVCFWILSVAISAQIAIVEPQPGTYVSGDYEVILSADAPEAIATLMLILDGEEVWRGEGFKPKVSLEFGEEIQAHTLQLKAILQDGTEVSTQPMRTRALVVDLQTTSRLILIPTVVKDRRDRPVPNLTREDFRVKENRRLVEVRTLEREELPLDLVLMLDTSSSLKENVETLKTAAKTFLAALEPSDRVALYEFKREVRQMTRFNNDRNAAYAKIDTLFSRGETALFDALIRGVSDLGERSRGRRALILFTDGRDSRYEDPWKKADLMRDAIRLAQNNEVTIYTLGLGDKIHEPSLVRIAEETGGRFLYTNRASGLAERFDEIISDLKNQYVLGIVPQATSKGFHRLEVDVKVRGADVYARKGYTIE